MYNNSNNSFSKQKKAGFLAQFSDTHKMILGGFFVVLAIIIQMMWGSDKIKAESEELLDIDQPAIYE